MVRRNGQSMAEYAIVMAGMVAAIAAIMLYAARAYKGRVFDAANQFVTESGGTTSQYEAYYEQSEATVEQTQNSTEKLTKGGAVESEAKSGSKQTGGQRIMGGAGDLGADDDWE